MDNKRRFILMGVWLIAITCFALSLAWKWNRENSGKLEKAIGAAGGKIIRNEKAADKAIVAVDFSGKKITDADLKHLGALPDLKALYLFNTPITDVGLRELTQFKDLQLLNIGKTKISDAGLKSISGLIGIGPSDLVEAHGVPCQWCDLTTCHMRR